MKGDTLQTNHFGTYVEMRENQIMPQEIEGVVSVGTKYGKYHETSVAFLVVDNTKYDLPIFMKKFNGKKVAVLARPWTRAVSDKVYHKLTVISVREIR